LQKSVSMSPMHVNSWIRIERCRYYEAFSPFFFSIKNCDLELIKSSFKKLLDGCIYINTDYNVIINVYTTYSKSVKISNTLFINCYNQGAVYCKSSVVFEMSDVGFYNCSSLTTYDAYYLTVSKQVSSRICICNCQKSGVSYYSYLNNDVNYNSCYYLSCSNCYTVSVKAYGYCYYHYWNVTNNYGSVGHAGSHPPQYSVKYSNFHNITSRDVIHPSAKTSGEISGCSFVKIKATMLVYYWGYGITLKHSYFVEYVGVVAKKNPSMTPAAGFQISNCYSDRAISADCGIISSTVIPGLQGQNHTIVGTCFAYLENIETLFFNPKQLSNKIWFFVLVN